MYQQPSSPVCSQGLSCSLRRQFQSSVLRSFSVPELNNLWVLCFSSLQRQSISNLPGLYTSSLCQLKQPIAPMLQHPISVLEIVRCRGWLHYAFDSLL